MEVSASIPRFLEPNALRDNPLSFLQAAHRAAGNIVVISEDGPIFSRANDCPAVVAVFGPAYLQQVLTDADLFGTAVSVGEHFSLPPTLNRLNAGLFSMKGTQHKFQQQILRSIINDEWLRDAADIIADGWRCFAEDLKVAEDVPLLTEMRRLVLHVSLRLVFGDADLALGKLIQLYFELRRSLSSTRSPLALVERRALIQMGNRLDRMLRARLQSLREEAASSVSARRCLLGRVIQLAAHEEAGLTEDQLIAHANTLFMSSSEPIAVSLTWILLVLTQQSALLRALQRELAQAPAAPTPANGEKATDYLLLRAVIQEVLRVLPPNAIMIRLTTQSGRLFGHELPANCEIVLSPFVAHRDLREFPNPNAIDPDRWRTLKPTPFTYLPFGLGARYCIGRQLANLMLASILSSILSRYDVVLTGSQELDWKINITMMPAQDPIVRFLPSRPQHEMPVSGRIGGPVAALVRF